MFKPLLRTLPSLSGNVKLVCYVNKDNIIEGKDNNYEAIVKNAKLYPISSDQLNYNINANLLKSSWDFDLRLFYNKYSDIFYKSTFEYNKEDISKFNVLNVNKDRDISFEFGCKRISYSKNDYQFAFYAPIYCEDVNELPEYFNIDIELKNQKYSIKKTLKIKIKDNNKYNYLGHYLVNYYKNVDDNVVFCNVKDNYSVYYGISLENGGITSAKDYISTKIWNLQNTIHNTDALLCNGFKRNKLCIKQIMPLCFYFNINDLLSKYELNKYYFTEAFISGYYSNKDIIYDKYDFCIDYDNLKLPKYKYNSNKGLLESQDSGKNIMTIIDKEIGLNEGNYINYMYSNKISPNFCRWKLKYSSDNDPYIINSSWSFSNNQDDQCFYGRFPQKYSDTVINGLCDIINSKYNFVLPIKNTISKYLKANMDNSYKSHIELMNKYSFNWMNLIDEYSDNIFLNNTLWESVNKDNKVYYNDVLYNLSEIYNKYPECPKVDKFGVFGKFEFDIEENVNNFNISKYAIIPFNLENNIKYNCNINNSEFPRIITDNNSENNYLWVNEYNDYDDNISLNNWFIQNDEGDYINLMEELPDGKLIDCYELNKYYDYDAINKDNYDIYYIKDVNGDNIQNNENDIYISNEECTIMGYVKLEISDLYEFKKLLNNYNKISENPIIDKIYMSSKNLINRYIPIYTDNMNNLPEYDINKEYNDFHFYQFYIYKRLVKSSYVHPKNSNNDFSELKHYMFNPILSDGNEIYAKNVFTLKHDDNIFCGKNIPNKYVNNDNNVIWVDIYNLKNIFNNYLSEDIWNIYINNDKLYKEFYANFLDYNHLYYFFQLLYKDHIENISNIYDKVYEILEILYIRERYFIIKNNDIEIKDKYTSFISKFGEIFNIKITNKNRNQILKTFNDNLLDQLVFEGNGVFSYNGNKFELCYKSKFIKFTKEIDDNISNISDLNKKYKDLYLYTLKDSDYSHTGIKYKENINDYIDINNCLTPLFNKVYLEPRESSKIYCQYSLANITQCSLPNKENRYTFFRYELDDFLYMYKINKNINTNVWDNYTKYNLNIIKSPSFYLPNNIKQYNNLLIKQVNGINYGYYIINIPIDNTNRSFNIVNDKIKPVKYFSYINKQDISNKKIDNFIIYNLLPFYKGNLYDIFNQISTIVYQSKIIYDIIYLVSKIQGNNKFYDIKYINKHIGKILLYRYFNQIKPLLLPQTNLNNIWRLKFKNIEESIIEQNYIDNNNFVIYNSNLNINKYNPVKIYNSISNIPDESFEEIEYKYFNNSKIINLPNEIIIKMNKKYNKDELVSLETENNIKEVFYNYIKTNTNFIDKEDINSSYKLLFLYNKYSKSFITNDAGLDYLHTTKLYYLTYKFNLL